jgi:hypothetical protein
MEGIYVSSEIWRSHGGSCENYCLWDLMTCMGDSM